MIITTIIQTGNQTSRSTGESLHNIFCKTPSNGIGGGNNTYSSAETSSTPEINQASVVDMDSVGLKENKSGELYRLLLYYYSNIMS